MCWWIVDHATCSSHPALQHIHKIAEVVWRVKHPAPERMTDNVKDRVGESVASGEGK